jgi:hypothetical protein
MLLARPDKVIGCVRAGPVAVQYPGFALQYPGCGPKQIGQRL